MKIILDNGKYVITGEHGVLEALRYGEPWRNLSGDNLIRCLCERHNELELLNNELRDALHDMLDMWRRSCKPRNIEFDSQVIAARAAMSRATVLRGQSSSNT